MTPGPKISPPKIPLQFLQWFCDPYLLEDVEGDLIELMHKRAEEDPGKARLLFARDVLFLFRPGIIRHFTFKLNRPTMLKNYFIVALRNAQKYKGHTFLNLLSLIVGVASCMLILLWIQDERGIDKFHQKEDRIYRVWRNMYQSGGEIITTGGIPQPLIETLRNDYPEVEEATLVGWDIETAVRKGDLVYNETGKYVEPGFLSIFSFPFLAGDPITALNDVSSIAISESMASRYFGNEWQKNNDIIGEILTLGSPRKDFRITGVFQDPGNNSSLDFDWLLPAQAYIKDNDWVTSWYNGGFAICFTLREDAELAPLQERIYQVINENTDNAADERIYIQKYSDNYLYSRFENGAPTGGRIQYIRILLIIAVFILVIACINFMNLATARSSRRTKEIGVRKVLGAQRGALRQQFFVESYILSSLSVLVAVFVVFVTLPYFNQITGKTLGLNLGDPNLWIGLGIITLITGTLSGIYPAILLPSFKVISSLKGTARISRGGIRLREGLVVFQFALSILLIVGTLVVSRQMSYILNKNLGLDKQNMIFVNMSRDVTGQLELYKTELLKIPEVAQVTSTSGNPIDYGRSSGSAQWPGKDPDVEVEINVLSVDPDFVSTMGIEIIRGRDFSVDMTTDTANFLINEVTAGIIGFDDPINVDLSLWGMTGKVVGVVKNFHMSSMYEPIAPLIIRNDPSATFVSFIRTQGNVQQALESIERVTAEVAPGNPFSYEFMDRNFAAAYRSEMTLGTIAWIFAIISILISCLGLFGLSSFSAEQRSREIGIRKVYGASVSSIVTLLSWGYTKLVLLAFILASPLAYFIMIKWLNNFEFRTDLNLAIFLLAGVITLAIGGFTVGFKSWQAALANPINTLKEE